MKISLNTGQNLFADGWSDYELLDSGDGQKLERFGPFLFSRPEPQALWSPRLSSKQWDKSSGNFFSTSDVQNTNGKAKWSLKFDLPKRWEMKFENVKFYATPTPFRHLGFFLINLPIGFGLPKK